MDRGSQLSKDDEDDEEDEEDEEEEERRTRQEEATYIKSNNPHLAGGELYMEQHITVFPSTLGVSVSRDAAMLKTF